MPDQPITTDDAIDRALTAHAAAGPDERVQHVEFWTFAEHLGKPMGGTAGWKLVLSRTFGNDARTTGPVTAAERSAERRTIITAWRRAYFDERRPRPSDIALPNTTRGGGRTGGA